MSRKALTLLIVGIVGILLLGTAAWLGITGLQAKSELQAASGALSRAKTAVTKGDIAGAKAAAAEAAQNTAAARADTSDPIWRLAGAVPLIGATPRTVTLTAQAADEVASGALPPLVAAANEFQGSELRQPDGSVDVARVRSAGADVILADGALQQATTTLGGAPTSGVLSPVADARAQLGDQLSSLSSATGTAARLLAVAPTLLGSERPQTYFIAFQSPVEIRGTGGFLGTYGIMTLDKGRLTVDKVATDSDLKNFPAPVVDLGPDYRQLYGNSPALWVNMNMSPNFPYAGQQWAKAWELQTGQRLDGVLGLNVTALQYLSEATGPVTGAKGQTIPADQLVDYLTNGIYADFPELSGPVNDARKEFQAQIGTDLLKRAINFRGSAASLLPELQKSVTGGHLLLWSAAPDVQRVLTETALAGATSTSQRPYLQLVLNNGAGNKMDYYLTRKLTYTGGACKGQWRDSTVDVVLTNTIPAEGELPPTLTLRVDSGAPGAPPRSNRTLVYLHTTSGSGMLKATLDGKPVGVSSGSELGHPVISMTLDLPAGKPVNLHLELTEPVLAGDPLMPVQPMVQPQQTDVAWEPCPAAGE